MITQYHLEKLNGLISCKKVLEAELKSKDNIVRADSDKEGLRYYCSEFYVDTAAFQISWIECKLKEVEEEIGYYMPN